MKNTLHIFRGLPGSGKTTRANRIGCLVVSPQDMFSTVGGEYRYADRIGESPSNDLQGRIQAWAEHLVRQTLAIGADVAVAETLCSLESLDRWVQIGLQKGAAVKVTDCVIEAWQSQKWNTHNVPAAVIDNMAEAWEPYSQPIKKTYDQQPNARERSKP